MRLPILTVALVALLAGPLRADQMVDHVTKQLVAQGYTQIHVSRTFLGRIRIEAFTEGAEREIILNPRTGEILRDYWETEGEGPALLLGRARTAGPVGTAQDGAGEDRDDDETGGDDEDAEEQDDSDGDEDGDEEDDGDEDDDEGTD